MSWCFCLVPHHVLSVVVIGQKELYYKQVPKNTRSMTGALLSSFRSRSERAAQARSWWWRCMAWNLDEGHIDLFYLVVTTITAANVC